MGVMNFMVVSLIKSACPSLPLDRGRPARPHGLACAKSGRDARGPRAERRRSGDLSSIKPKHFAAAFLGIEPQEARLRISLLQYPTVASDLTKQARAGRQVAT